MKTNTAKNDVTVNALETASYTISDEAKIFGMLMDGLYEDKITSITREIWTNAVDAHIDAGCPERPFEVSLPNLFTPVFTVRDYGVSLTHKQVMTLYTSLGRSTKENTDDTAGKWGIGSKAPFSYTDTFTVTAIKDGVRTFYASTKDEENKPIINVMGREDTTDEEGVEVSFPVHKEDINSFRTAAQRVSYGFDVKPLVINEADHPGWDELPVMLEGNGWKLLSDIPTGFNRGSYALMGPVLYPITPSAMSDLSYEQKRMLSYQFVFDFPMGALGIPIHRESLSYGRKDPTSATIIERVIAVMDELEAVFLAKYAAMPTLWEATKALSDDLGESAIPDPVRELVLKNARWAGEKLSTSINCELEGSTTTCHVGRDRLRNKIVRFNTGNTRGQRSEATLTPRGNPLVVIEDLSMDKPVKRVGERIKLFAERSSHGSILWIKFYAGYKSSPSMTRFLDRIEGATVVLAHDLHAPERPAYERGEYVPVQARLFNGYNFDRKTTLSKEEHEAGGFYVKMERGEVCAYLDHSSAWRTLVNMGVLSGNEQFIGVPKTLWKKFSGDQWAEFDVFAKKILVDRKAKLNGSMEVFTAQREVQNNEVMTYLTRHIDVTALHKNSAAGDAIAFMADTLATDTSEASSVVSLTRACGRSVEEHVALADDSEYGIHRELLNVTYPLLDTLHDNYAFNRQDNSVDKLNEYVNMCDKV